jgi:hydroxymethylbilane synthase
MVQVLIMMLLLLLLPDTMMANAKSLRVGSRPSPLARIQAQAVAQAMVAANPSLEPPTMVVMYASGDKAIKASNIQDSPLALQSVDFTGSLDQALKDGTIDVAVHSLKDIPPTRRWQKGEGGLVLACPLPREDPADVLVGPFSSLWDIPNGSKIGTSSIRRQAQLKSLFYKKKDIQVVNIRGNLDSRLRALEEGVVDALILAQSGLNRLERHHNNDDNDDEWRRELSYTPIPTTIMLPGVCQGIVAAVYRPSDDTHPFEAWFPQNHESLLAASAERAFLDALDESSPWAGRPPLAGLMEQKTNSDNNNNNNNNTPSSSWTFRGLLARPDGSRVLEATGELPGDCTKADAEELGSQIGLELLAQSGGIHFYD